VCCFFYRGPLLKALIDLFELPHDDAVADDEHFIEVDDTAGTTVDIASYFPYCCMRTPRSIILPLMYTHLRNASSTRFNKQSWRPNTMPIRQRFAKRARSVTTVTGF